MDSFLAYVRHSVLVAAKTSTFHLTGEAPCLVRSARADEHREGRKGIELMAWLPHLRVLTLAIGFVSSLAAPRQAAAAGTVTFTVQASKATYAAGETPAFTMTLALAAGAPGPVTVCPLDFGSVRILRVTRDGVRVRPTRTVMRFYEEPAVFQKEALTALVPGSSVAIPYDPGVAVDGGTPELHDVRTAPRITRDHKVLRYTLTRPGAYVVQFAYHYQGPDGGRPNVLKTRIPSNVVNFSLQ